MKAKNSQYNFIRSLELLSILNMITLFSIVALLLVYKKEPFLLS